MDNKDNLEIVRTIVMLAQNLKMTVVAEGVETAAQVAMLQEMDCQFGQGFYFSRPLAANDAAKLLADNSAFKILPPDGIIDYESTLVA